MRYPVIFAVKHKILTCVADCKEKLRTRVYVPKNTSSSTTMTTLAGICASDDEKGDQQSLRCIENKQWVTNR